MGRPLSTETVPPCHRCKTTEGYVRAGNVRPGRHNGKRYGVDAPLCSDCINFVRRRAAGHAVRVKLEPLTSEQQQRVADHWQVALAVAKKYQRPKEQFGPAFESEAALGLCRAAQFWTPDKPYPFSSAAYTAARCKCRDSIKKTKARGFTGGPEAPFPDAYDAGPEPVASPRPVGREIENSEAFEAIVSRVPEHHAEILRLVYRDGLHVHEAATKVGITAAQASRLKCDALEMLRKEMGVAA